jgi:hypothetical protein
VVTTLSSVEQDQPLRLPASKPLLVSRFEAAALAEAMLVARAAVPANNTVAVARAVLRFNLRSGPLRADRKRCDMVIPPRTVGVVGLVVRWGVTRAGSELRPASGGLPAATRRGWV